MALARLLASPAFRVFITGAGFFSDSYDLFVTDGVTTILKDLGPVSKVTYSYYAAGALQPPLVSYFSAYCTQGLACLPRLYNNATSAWEANPASAWTPEFTPHYQLQTPALKNGVSNAALIGSITGQIAFGFAGDVLGRKWCFVVTTLLIIVGCLGSATAAAGARVPSALNAAGCWGSAGAQPSGFATDVYGQLILWRAVLGFGVGGEYPLAGTIASEGAETAKRGKAVLYTFSMQGWGSACGGGARARRCCSLPRAAPRRASRHALPSSLSLSPPPTRQSSLPASSTTFSCAISRTLGARGRWTMRGALRWRWGAR